MNKELIEAENSFLYFLILLQQLRLSEKAGSRLVSAAPLLQAFILRNQVYLRRPNGILIL